MPKKLTWEQAIKKVLSESDEPLHYADLTDLILAQKLVGKTVGAVPKGVVNKILSSSIKHKKEASPYIRVSAGVFQLKTRLSGMEVEQVGKTEEEEQYEIISSYGMFWKRDNVNWVSKSKLLGIQHSDATSIDFYAQIGIYLLYDGREVVYVGRTTERPLGKRLYEHTKDRMSARWDRFSWFGLLPVSDNGTLGVLPDKHDATKFIPALEAILIESLEPRQNRKKGDDLSAVEYLHKVDPELANKRLAQAILKQSA